jgi:pimeloyl-ACP methyl ester carboxylesterase
MRRILVALVAVALVLCACVEETGRPDTDAPSVSFKTSDGITLRGHLFGTGNSWIILSHEFPDDQSAWFPFAGELAGRHYHVLTFDFRGYGESDGNKQIDHGATDLAAALEYVRTQHPTRVVLLGASMGGTASVIVAASQPVDGVIGLSAPEQFRGMNAIDVANKITAPALFVAGKEDDGAEQSAADLYDQLNPERTRLDILNGSAHGVSLLTSPVAAQVRSDIYGFLSRVAPPS